MWWGGGEGGYPVCDHGQGARGMHTRKSKGGKGRVRKQSCILLAKPLSLLKKKKYKRHRR